jgi:hypothetical protein
MRYGIIKIEIKPFITVPEISTMKKIINANKKTFLTILKASSRAKTLKIKDKMKCCKLRHDIVIGKLKLVIKEAITISCLSLEVNLTS